MKKKEEAGSEYTYSTSHAFAWSYIAIAIQVHFEIVNIIQNSLFITQKKRQRWYLKWIHERWTLFNWCFDLLFPHFFFAAKKKKRFSSSFLYSIHFPFLHFAQSVECLFCYNKNLARLGALILMQVELSSDLF